jgi:hypothetical protein
MIQIALCNHLYAQSLKIAEVAHYELPRKAHLLTREEEWDEDVARRQAKPIGAGEMIIQPRAWVPRFDLAKPANAHAKFARQVALRQAPFLPCLFYLPP